jgi:hypothetical protein
MDSAFSAPGMYGIGTYYNQRLPTDPFFFADVIIQNIVAGSRYWIAQATDLTNVLAAGTAGSSKFTVPSIPAYDNPMLLEIRVRKASEPVKYQPYVTYAYLARGGITVYIAQVQDNVA